MHILYLFPEQGQFSYLWFLQVKCVLHLPGWMVLWNKKAIQIPEAKLYHAACHLLEAHVNPYGFYVINSLADKMPFPTANFRDIYSYIIFTECLTLPLPCPKKRRSQSILCLYCNLYSLKLLAEISEAYGFY